MKRVYAALLLIFPVWLYGQDAGKHEARIMNVLLGYCHALVSLYGTEGVVFNLRRVLARQQPNAIFVKIPLAY